MLFFFYGEDDYRSREKLVQMKEKFIQDVDSSGCNIVTLDEKITVESFAREFAQGGFLASKKLIVIKNLLQQNISKALFEVVVEYIDKDQGDQDDNMVVFYEDNLPHSSKKALSGDRLKLWKKLSAFKYSIEFKRLPDFKLVAYLQSEFQKYDKLINSKLANLIISMVGNDLWLLNNEVIKLSHYNQDKEITEESIKELVSSSLNDNIFLLTEKMADKDNLGATKLLQDQLTLGVNSQYLLSMIIRQYRILLQMKAALDEGMNQGDLARYLSLHPFVVKKSMGAVKKHSILELKEIYDKLLNLDRSLKSSKLRPATLLNLFVAGF
jgi:DNA polymerase-3 subunit delta